MTIGSLVRIFNKDGLLHTEGVLLKVSRRNLSRWRNILTFTVRCPLSAASVSGMQVMVEYEQDGETWERLMKLGGHTKSEGQIVSELHTYEEITPPAP